MTPEQWLSDFEAKIADVEAKAARFEESMTGAGTTEASADGSVTVTVQPNGALSELRITDAAMRQSGDALAERIMELTRSARRTAAAKIVSSEDTATRALNAIANPEPAAEPPAPPPPPRRRREYEESVEAQTTVTNEDAW
ncbi:YbaB/EbfC DNA-binding family protein [Herbihabitans rhizosphaerae]|uniref:YbaB/EbfC DNA-binding family protein n=1 Tax=Herbihabitans rhizosphaerae TaxID=1872711 RepID=A0A4Q7KC46_9PSEU|nr:YbaB/EbfC family nucleoid-associated protein [Herbihabitans rhizosphaerae]RZS29805.1 YbaB/EbfC DNA-binding family protein [Herbihabitans rhizosphaerae]